jgi:carbamoyl-phosphate synthase large subunit
MNLLFSCIGKRGYIADFFREVLGPDDCIFGTGNTPWTPGFTACDASFLLPDIDAPGYAEAVLTLCREQSIDGLLSFHDLDVLTLAQHRAAFAALGVRLLIPSAEAAACAFDKYRMFTFLRNAGIPTPRTVLSVPEAEPLGFPVVVKPRRGSGSRNTFIAQSQAQLEVFFECAPDMIIQEFVAGMEFDIELCGDLNGELVGFSSWIKHQSRHGETERAETFRDPAVFGLGTRLARLLRVAGPMDIDLIRRDDVMYVLDCNPRFGGGYPVSHLAGAAFPALLVECIRTGAVRSRFDFRPGVVMMKRLEIFGGEVADVERSILRVARVD